jgi:hypothetical protein
LHRRHLFESPFLDGTLFGVDRNAERQCVMGTEDIRRSWAGITLYACRVTFVMVGSGLEAPRQLFAACVWSVFRLGSIAPNLAFTMPNY